MADEPAQVYETPAADPKGEHVCPECGDSFPGPSQLGFHRYHKHGVAGSKRKGGGSAQPRRGRSQGQGQTRQQRRRNAVRDTITELVDFADELRGRSVAPAVDLADVLRRDADRIATALSWAAERFNPLGWGIDKLAGHGGVLTLVGGFSGVATWLLRRWRQLVSEQEGQVLRPAEDAWRRPEPELVGDPTTDPFPPLPTDETGATVLFVDEPGYAPVGE